MSFRKYLFVLPVNLPRNFETSTNSTIMSDNDNTTESTTSTENVDNTSTNSTENTTEETTNTEASTVKVDEVDTKVDNVETVSTETNQPPVIEEPVKVEETDTAVTSPDYKTRSNAIILKHGNGQMNENHLPGHFARNILSKFPENSPENVIELTGVIKSILYGEAENEYVLKLMEDMPIGGYGY